MAKEPERPVQQPLLDRLRDDHPELAGDPTLTRADSVRLLKDSVRRDLEDLLNTRRVGLGDPETQPELARSILYYGIPDLSSMSRDSPEVLTRLARSLEQVIAAHEPRLDNVRIALAPRDAGPLSEVRFTVEAMLRLDPSPERVAFDTVLAKGSGEVEIRGVTDA
jgi:type VI secretion system protein ImpF